ncbi:MAG: helix-turn-helix transcriptional regulator [Rhodospirillaceae bacterium]
MPTPLGERIRKLRTEKGLTLEGLAEKVDSSKSYIWEIENKSVARPSAEKLRLIAIALDTTTDYLLAAEEVNPGNEADRAFFRKYQALEEPAKKRLQRILNALDEEDE